eukprot:2061266-Rhodomonas_salina.2
MAVDKRLTRQFDLTKTGVTSDAGTSINAYIMVASSLLFLTQQVCPCPPPFHPQHETDLSSSHLTCAALSQIPSVTGYMHYPAAALWGRILCLISLDAYCVFQ